MSAITVRIEILVFLCISFSSLSFSDNSTPEILIGSLNVTVNVPKLDGFENVTVQKIIEESEEINRSAPVKRLKEGPVKNIIFGIYKNFRSTLLENRTSSKYRKISRDRWRPAMKDFPSFSKSEVSEAFPQTKRRKKKKRKTSEIDRTSLYNYDGEYRYNFGEGVNVTLDMKRDIVNVNLDEDCLRDVLTDFSFDDYDEEGREKQYNKKYEMISKVIPLLILPYLIQSAIIPFIVTKLKLLLIKSILVGKLAIFLLVISAIRNNQNMNNNYESAPSYWAWEPNRRSSVVQGYKVEGQPHIWVNK